MLGFQRDDYAGILLSVEALIELEKKAEQYAKTNRSKQDSRRSRAPVRRPRK